MGRRFWIGGFVASVLSIAAELVWVGIKRDLAPADWAAWIAAIGTVGTLCGTAYLANAETRRRTAQEVARGIVVAATMAPRLATLAQEIRSFATRLDFDNLETGEKNPAGDEANEFLRIEFISATTGELADLVGLPNNVAVKFALAQARLAEVQMQIREYLLTVKDPGIPLPTEIADCWRNWADELGQRVEWISRECMTAAQIHGAPPTTEELFGHLIE